MANVTGRIGGIQGVFNNSNQFIGISDPTTTGDGADYLLPTYGTDSNNIITGLVKNDGATIKLKKPRGMVEQYSAGGGANAGASWISGGANTTYQLFLALRGKPYAVRAIYGNPFTSSYTMDANTVFFSPIEPAGVGNGSMNPTGATAVSLGSIIVSAATTVGNTVYTATPWVNVNPVERTDFPNSFYQVAVRSYSTLGGNPIDTGTYAVNYPLNQGDFSETQGIPNLSRWANSVSGNVTANPTGIIRGNNPGFLTFMSLEFAVTAKVLKVVSLGDSITAAGAAGNSAATGKGSQYYSWVERAVNLVNQSVASSNYYLSHANLGYGGAGITNASYNFITNISNTLTALKPDVLVLATWSPNQAPSTQAGYDTNLGKVLQAIQLVNEANAVPLLWTGLPTSNLSSAQEVYRLQHNAMLRKLASEGNIALVDLDAVITNGATPVANFKAGLSTDNLHPNFDAQTLMAAELAKVLKNISIE